MGAGTSKIPDLKNLSVTQLEELENKIIPELIIKAKEREGNQTLQKSETSEEQDKNEASVEEDKSPTSPSKGGKKRRKNTKKHKKKHMKKTGKK